MSDSQIKRKAFFNSHPTCCFCGGNTMATTEDHFPGRAIFEKKIWPEGYVFPACQKCNKESSDDELVVSILARTSENQIKTTNQHKELNKSVETLFRQMPELRSEIKKISRGAEVRKLKDLNIPAWNPQTSNQRKILLIPKIMMVRASNFGIKLGKALHYKHTGNIVPIDATVKCRSFTNIEISKIDNNLLENIRQLPEMPSIVRSTKPLNDQFEYKYVLTNDSLQSVFSVVFGKDALLLIIIVDTKSTLDLSYFDKSKT